MNKIYNSYSINLDLIRVVALFFVTAVHFFLNTGYYSGGQDSSTTLSIFIFKNIFMTCVPLFIILTGYLNTNLELNLKYYTKIFKVLSIYLIASIVCILYKGYYLDVPISFLSSIKSLLDFSGANYSWYIEMYIGLFIIAPFLNILYYNVKTQKDKKILIISVVLMFFVPSLLNINFKIFPSWWVSAYPIGYFLIGKYIREYQPKLTNLSALSTVLGTSILTLGIYYILKINEITYGSIQLTEYYGLSSFVISAVLFIVLLNINLKNTSQSLKYILKTISGLSLGAYLLSFIADSFFYKTLFPINAIYPNAIKYFIIIVPLVFVSSVLLSGLINPIAKMVERVSLIIINKIFDIRRKNYE